MSAWQFPQVNTGKIIGEMNWDSASLYCPTRTNLYDFVTHDFIIPINRNEINEFAISGTTSSKEVTDDNLYSFDSSDNNSKGKNYALSIRQMTVGNIVYSSGISGSYNFYLILLSEQENSFVLQFQYAQKSSNAYAGIKIGWR